FACPRGFLEKGHLAIDAQYFGHFRLEIGIAAFQIIAHLVRFHLVLVEYLAHRALRQMGKTRVSRRRPMFTRMARQQARRPHLVRVAELLRLAAGQRHQPNLGLVRDDGRFAGPRTFVERGQRATGHRPCHAALHGLMVQPQSPANREKRRLVTVASKIRARSTRLAGSVRERAIVVSRAKSPSSITNANACRHAAMCVNSLANQAEGYTEAESE